MTAINTSFLEQEFDWLGKVVKALAASDGSFPTPAAASEGQWAAFVSAHKLDTNERLLIGLCLAQYLLPGLLQPLMDDANTFRLMQCPKTGQLLPTGETFVRMVAGNSLGDRIVALGYLDTGHLFYQKGIYTLGEAGEGLGAHFGVLRISPNYRDLFLHDRHSRPRFSHEFPAHLLETALEWDALILNDVAARKLHDVRDYLAHEKELRQTWGLDRQLRNGYRCLFHGPSGTGKTLAATLLGKLLERDVYRVDLSTVVSKYVGETSKNLNALFNTAEDKHWVLFFDEGDALFGKRVNVGQGNDGNAHFANQDTAFLLQRIENYNGLVIVASNLKQNMDDAFIRRFQSVIPFEVQDEARRLEVWRRHLPKNCTLDPKVNLEQLAHLHRFSAASIVDICNRLALMTLQSGTTTISVGNLEMCIREELYK